MEWRPIESAPKDGTLVLCWRHGWDDYLLLRWKFNMRLDPTRDFMTNEERAVVSKYVAHYFGDPNEMDDYDFAHVDGRDAPTHWFPIPPPPPSPSP